MNFTTPPTYEVSVKSESSIIKEHVKYQAGLGITVKDDYRHLPKHYWTPKMHKQVVSERFITASVVLNHWHKMLRKFSSVFIILHGLITEQRSFTLV